MGWSEATDGVGDENGVGGFEIVLGYDFFLGEGAGGEEVAAEDAVEQAAVERWGVEMMAFADKNGADGSFGDLSTFVEKEYFVAAVLAGKGERAVVELPFGGFVVKQGVCGIGSLCSNTHAELCGGMLHLYGFITDTEGSLR